jgi:hypothetical protein
MVSNIVKYPNLKPFKSGEEWNGNRIGRPKNNYKRDKFTDEIFEKHKGDIEKITQVLFEEAQERKPWAIKLVIEYFLTRPKNDESAEETANNNDLVEKLKAIPSSKLVAIHKMLSEEINDEGD